MRMRFRNLVELAKCHLWWNRPGHWEWLHEFKTCPAGERHCPHYRWKRDRS